METGGCIGVGPGSSLLDAHDTVGQREQFAIALVGSSSGSASSVASTAELKSTSTEDSALLDHDVCYWRRMHRWTIYILSPLYGRDGLIESINRSEIP